MPFMFQKSVPANQNGEIGPELELEHKIDSTHITKPQQKAMYFCAACNLYVHETTGREHDQTTAHLLATTRTPSLKKVWLPESNRGYQMLKDMGWKEDKGLGPTGEGRVEPIATVLKNDRAGLAVPHAPARVTHHPPMDFAEKARRTAARRARKRKDTSTESASDDEMDPHNLTSKQRKQLKTNEQQRDKDIAMELYTPDGLEGYEAYLR